ncbi:uncharacterized protein [Palaemon carinicauda]|uniref:uncharacterized protein n=1 Tax=Palaemon carinicauda TaxID=392227 RepID=UPI0035B67A13
MSRFPEAIPMRSIRSEKIIDNLIGFFTKFDIPRTLQSDCATNFTRREWDKEVPYALFSIRSIPNEALGYSPFEVVFGHCVHGPLEVVREHLEGETLEINILDCLSGLQEKLRKAWEFAKENLEESQEVMKNKFDVGTQKRVFKPGDSVLVLLPFQEILRGHSFKGPGRF